MGGWFSRHQHDAAVDFVSFGMVVLDELRFPGKAPLLDIMGGSGAYGTLGARVFAMGGHSTAIGCLVLAGKDFPAAVESTLCDWKMTLFLKKDPNKLSTRGLLEYEDTTFGPKKFRYTTEPLRPSPSDLVASNLLSARCYHFLSKPEDISCQVPELLELRRLHGINNRPWIVWEPFPAACRPENLDATIDACKLVDMFSPNHLEMMKLFGDESNGDFQPKLSEIQAQKFLDHSVGPEGQGCIVIRAAEHGCLSASRASGLCWSPAFYGPGSDVSRVVDPTGAGNAFIGGFAIAMVHELALDEAVAYGNVAASFALEQIGAPILKIEGLRETWNGDNVMDRLEQYKRRSQKE